MWQILSAELDRKVIRIRALVMNPVILWVVVGGKEAISISGLYVTIKQFEQASKLEMAATKDQKDGDIFLIKLNKEIEEGLRVRIIFESKSMKGQTFFLIATYASAKKKLRLERQELQWNSLAFEL